MGFFDLFRRDGSATARGRLRPHAYAGETFEGLNDPALLGYLRGGSETASGSYISASNALRNTAVLRCVNLHRRSIGMLPLQLYERGENRRKAEEHPVYNVLHRQPNKWQTPFEFKSLMHLRMLQNGVAYARQIRAGNTLLGLVPLKHSQVRVEQQDDWEMHYFYTRPGGGVVELKQEDMFVLRDLSEDGINCVSRIDLAREAIGLAQGAEKAAARLFKNGMIVGGALKHPEKLSDVAFERLKESLTEREGAENAHKWLILEEGMAAEKFAQTATDSQHIENRNHQIEEIARVFDVPRPLLMMDDTSWGSGIEQLGIFFLQYGLAPGFTIWEEAVMRDLLRGTEKDRYYAKFNERALLRGTTNDQSEFFAKALGSGGHDPWMTVDEVRDLSELPRAGGRSGQLQPGSGKKKDTANESAKAA
jgi:HK97 family phage portal protein